MCASESSGLLENEQGRLQSRPGRGSTPATTVAACSDLQYVEGGIP